ncbi:MAG: cupin domain-containing protein [Silvanigrellaceae bacterium]
MFLKKSFFVCAAALSVFASASAFAKGKNQLKIVPYSEVAWKDVQGTPLKTADLWGDQTKGAHGRYLKLPGGFEAGMHSHAAPYHGVLISGTWLHWEEGTPVELAPGSYVMQPGKIDHNDKCKEGADCVVLLISDKKADYIPAKSAKK